MKFITILFFFFLFWIAPAFGQIDTTPQKQSSNINTSRPNTIPKTNDGLGDSGNSTDWVSQFNAQAAYTFTGKNKGLENLTPIIHLGTEYELYAKGKFTWSLDLDPYLGSQLNTKDSSSLIPALMLPGNGGLIMNNYLKIKINKIILTIAPLNFGIKFLANFLDSGNLIIQHNLRTGFAIDYDDKFMLGAQLTQGWHNASSESERFFKKIFSGNNSTSITYITILLQFKIAEKLIDQNEESKKNTYAFFEFRDLLSKNKFAGFTNNRILTIGLRKDLSLRNIFVSRARTRN